MTTEPHNPNAEAGVQRIIVPRGRSARELTALRAAEAPSSSATRVLHLLLASNLGGARLAAFLAVEDARLVERCLRARWHAARGER